jgi:hypothetical protein
MPYIIQKLKPTNVQGRTIIRHACRNCDRIGHPTPRQQNSLPATEPASYSTPHEFRNDTNDYDPYYYSTPIALVLKPNTGHNSTPVTLVTSRNMGCSTPAPVALAVSPTNTRVYPHSRYTGCLAKHGTSYLCARCTGGNAKRGTPH